MRHLSVARDRELRHTALGQISWRVTWNHSARYAWCRICGRNADRQINWLIEDGYIEAPKREAVIALITADGETYLERYPR